jgi:nucleoside-diphosphate-sugar epimerase
MKKEILITGANGTIGSILTNGLKGDYHLIPAGLPEVDVRNYKIIKKLSKGKDVIIHLAWNTKTENFMSKQIDTDNSLMFENVYRSALENKIKRVIVASSIHADNFQNYKGKIKLKTDKLPEPQNPYGAHKVFMEALGNYYSRKGIEVVCVRFGAVEYEKPTKKDSEGSSVWLSNPDCIRLIKTIINAKKIPNNYFIMNGVSNNKTRIHDYSNPLGWKPKDDSSRC